MLKYYVTAAVVLFYFAAESLHAGVLLAQFANWLGAAPRSVFSLFCTSIFCGGLAGGVWLGRHAAADEQTSIDAQAWEDVQ